MSDNIINRAAQFAKAAHVNQFDDDGKNHFAHCAIVAEIIELLLPYDDELIAAAYLHDVVEDTGITYTELRAHFGDDVADLVDEVTKVGGEFGQLKSERGIILKFADRLHNLSRMTAWPKQKRDNYLEKSEFWK